MIGRVDHRSAWFWLSLAILAALCLVLLYPLVNLLASSFGRARPTA